jgi:hypothetical protein
MTVKLHRHTLAWCSVCDAWVKVVRKLQRDAPFNEREDALRGAGCSGVPQAVLEVCHVPAAVLRKVGTKLSSELRLDRHLLQAIARACEQSVFGARERYQSFQLDGSGPFCLLAKLHTHRTLKVVASFAYEPNNAQDKFHQKGTGDSRKASPVCERASESSYFLL